MEACPIDVLVVILENLAVQDPLSFLRAVASCPAVEGPAKGNPALWKETFHGSAKERSRVRGPSKQPSGTGRKARG